MEGGSKNPSAAKQEVVDMSKFLYLADPDSCKMKNVTSMENFVRYLNLVREKGVGPLGWLVTLQDDMKMVIPGLPNDGGDKETKELVMRAKVVETKLKGIHCKEPAEGEWRHQTAKAGDV